MTNTQLTAIRQMADAMSTDAYKIYDRAANVILMEGLTGEQAKKQINVLNNVNLIICK